MTVAIETNNLLKKYGDVTAVNGVSLRVAAGEIYAFLGLNGAGKTTTIRMLLGMVKPTSGEANVLGNRNSCWWQKTVGFCWLFSRDGRCLSRSHRAPESGSHAQATSWYRAKSRGSHH